MERIFVSSTCYDLIDARAELQAQLTELGFAPLLSDRPSDFENPGDRDSIETCLVNVRQARIFVCVLSQRYGPRLGGCGFENVSATHLEYLEAKKNGSRIYFYVRDRLEGEYGLWLKNKDAAPKFTWIKHPADYGLFEMIEQHKQLVAGAPATNWYSVFRDSIELKRLMASDLRAVSGLAILRRLIDTGQLPFISITSSISHSQSDERVAQPTLALVLRNLGNRPAFDVRLEVEAPNGGVNASIGDLGAGAEVRRRETLSLPTKAVAPQEWHYRASLKYATAEGHRVEDQYALEIVRAVVARFTLRARKYLGGPLYELFGPSD